MAHEPLSSHPLTFGVVTGQHQLAFSDLVEQWQTAEALGFDAVYLFDHFFTLYGDPDGPCLEASTLLAALALKTTRVKLGVLVFGNTHRHPAILAKEIVTVDHVSAGRAILGIGTGWNEREHRAYSIHFPSAGQRVAMLDEALTVIHALFREPRTTFTGRFYQLHDAPFSPKPVQARLPILVGGKQPKMLRLIAKHADIWDSHSAPEELRARGEEIRRHCREHGRDPHEIAFSVSLGADRLEDERGFPDLIRAYRAAGASQFLFDFPLSATGQRATERIARDIIPALRQEFAPVLSP